MQDRPNHNERRRALRTLGAIAGAPWLGPALANADANAPRRIGVALGSGAQHGYAHLGAIRAFEQLGLAPAVITGTSVGAIVGALWAAGVSIEAMEAFADDPAWRDFQRLRLPRLGLFTLDGLRQAIDRRVAGASIEGFKTRFAALATDVASGLAVTLDRGAPGQAVAASASVPLLFEPVKIDGRELIDGALSAPVPIDAARALGADFVIALDFAYRPYEEPVGGVLAMAHQMLHIVVSRLIDEQMRRADFALRFDVHRLMQGADGARALIRFGETAVRTAWPALQKKLTDASVRGRTDRFPARTR